jgi:transcriptional regulator with XRE-family HTH domain
MKLGYKIKKIRDIKGLKQDEMASLLNISTQAYSKIERNETKMDDERLNQIAKIFGLSPDEIKNFDEKNLFINNNNEYENSNQSTGQTIIKRAIFVTIFLFNFIDKRIKL